MGRKARGRNGKRWALYLNDQSAMLSPQEKEEVRQVMNLLDEWQDAGKLRENVVKAVLGLPQHTPQPKAQESLSIHDLHTLLSDFGQYLIDELRGNMQFVEPAKKRGGKAGKQSEHNDAGIPKEWQDFAAQSVTSYLDRSRPAGDEDDD